MINLTVVSISKIIIVIGSVLFAMGILIECTWLIDSARTYLSNPQGNLNYYEVDYLAKVLLSIGAIVIMIGIVFHAMVHRPKMSGEGGRWRINALCLIGAIIGIFCVVTPWTFNIITGEFIRHFAFDSITPFDVARGLSFDNVVISANTTIAVLIMILGIAFSFITPLGGFVQLGGLIAYAAYTPYIISRVRIPEAIVKVDNFVFGFFLGLLSASLCLLSIWKPLGFGYGDKSIRWKERLINFGKNKSELDA